MSSLSNSTLLKSSEQQLAFSKKLVAARTVNADQLDQIKTTAPIGTGHGPILINDSSEAVYDLSSRVPLLGHGHPLKLLAEVAKQSFTGTLEDQLSRLSNLDSPYQFEITDKEVRVFNPAFPHFDIFTLSLGPDDSFLHLVLRYFLESGTFLKTGRVKSIEELLSKHFPHQKRHDNFLEISTNSFSHAKIKLDEGNQLNGAIFFRFPIAIKESHIEEIKDLVADGLKG